MFKKKPESIDAVYRVNERFVFSVNGLSKIKNYSLSNFATRSVANDIVDLLSFLLKKLKKGETFNASIFAKLVNYLKKLSTYEQKVIQVEMTHTVLQELNRLSEEYLDIEAEYISVYGITKGISLLPTDLDPENLKLKNPETKAEWDAYKDEYKRFMDTLHVVNNTGHLKKVDYSNPVVPETYRLGRNNMTRLEKLHHKYDFLVNKTKPKEYYNSNT